MLAVTKRPSAYAGAPAFLLLWAMIVLAVRRTLVAGGVVGVLAMCLIS